MIKRRDVLIGGLAVCFLLPLLLHAYAGTYIRLMTDDYCTMLYGMRDGLIGGLIVQYNTWAGQFSNILAKNMVGIAGGWLVPLLPALALTSWLLAALWTAGGIQRLLGRTLAPGWSLLAAAIFVFAVVDGAPARVQSLYWMAALVPYLLPLVGATVWLGTAARCLAAARCLGHKGRPSAKVLTVLALIAFFSAGFSEVYASLQAGILLTAAGLLLFVRDLRPRLLPLLLPSLAATLLAMAIIIAAPGNAIRRASFPPPPPMTELIVTAGVQALALVIVALTRFAPAGALGSFGLGAAPAALSGLGSRVGRPLWVALAISLIVFGGVGAYVAAGIYGTGWIPPARTYIIPQYAIITGVIAVGWIAGGIIQKRRFEPGSRPRQAVAAMLLVIVLMAGPLRTSAEIMMTLPVLRAAATEWDTRDRQIRALAAAGETRIMLPHNPLDLAPQLGLQTLSADPEFWVNRCAADYYGVEALFVADAS